MRAAVWNTAPRCTAARSNCHSLSTSHKALTWWVLTNPIRRFKRTDFGLSGFRPIKRRYCEALKANLERGSSHFSFKR